VSGSSILEGSFEIEDLESIRARLERLERECAELRQHNRRLSGLVERDPVSGLFSRRHFDARLEHEWDRAEQLWTPLSLILIGIDELAHLHETLGVAAVHELLAQIGMHLEERGRSVDVRCRIASDTLAVILPATNRTGAESELQRLEDEMQDVTASLPVDVQLCFGMAVAFDEAQTPLELVMLADEAMLIDKRSLSDEAPTTPHIGIPTWIDAA
jgi:diguanylate cyclase (GGDEF)-like protein